MVMQKFEVKGTFLMGEDWMPYTKVIAAPNEKQAQERTYTVLGSKHRLERRYIKITGVSPLKGE
ncbi:MAG: 50S ribosomal protein L18Ae [Methanoregula sp.]|jgi:large subunit ribosomal protein LX